MPSRLIRYEHFDNESVKSMQKDLKPVAAPRVRDATTPFQIVAKNLAKGKEENTADLSKIDQIVTALET